MNFGVLIEALSSLSEGDLLEGIQTLDTAKALAESAGDEDRASLELVNHVIEKLSRWMKDGFSDKWEDERDTLVASMQNLGGDAAEAAAEPQEHREDADYDLVISFIAESRNHLEDIETRLLAMESTDDPELVNGVFRSIHTIKGVSSFLGLPQVKTLSHALETTLDDLRNGGRKITTELIDVLLEGSDRLTAFVDALDSWAASVDQQHPGPLDEPDVEIDDILIRLKALDGMAEVEKVEAPVESVIKPSGPEPDMSLPLFTPEMIVSFVHESLEIVDASEKALMDLDEGGGKESLDEAFRGVHTVKGNAGFFAQAEIEQFCQSLESVMDAMRRGDRNKGAGTVTGLLDGLDALRRKLNAIAGDEPGKNDEPKSKDDTVEGAQSLGEVLIEMGAAKQEDVDAALDSQSRRLGEILVDNGIVEAEKIKKALEVQNSRAKKVETSAVPSAKRDVRVDTGRLDNLFTLIGELITAHAMVTNSPDVLGKDLPEFEKAASSLGKIIRDVQTLSMSIRMIPLDGLFSKMRRLTRDLARKFNKAVEFQSFGEDTEMDRQIIEQISDPLVHIVRNAVDHGLESTNKRQEAGKPSTGTVTLSAKYEGNEVWISVTDDGGGLSRDKILARAHERGMDLGEDDGASMDDRSVWSLIFEPGFSTAETVSDVSGRGVGMDVVRRNLEKLRGQVSVDSEDGHGSTVTLQIPMTLAIIDGITFHSGGILFALPIADILEFHQASEEGITTAPSGRRILKLREDLLPVITLEDFYRIDRQQDDDDTSSVYIILGSGDRQAAIPADEILGNQQLVIKALPDHLKGVRALSGCAILGNGDVCLILDVGFILNAELGGERR